MSNLLVAIKNIIECQNLELKKIVVAKNRANAEGDALESFIKDSFTNTFGEKGKNRWSNKCFSYLGNSNNPPDIMIKGGDAIEVKKVESLSNIVLNNFPKDKLKCDDENISSIVKSCEEWNEKDLLYCFGEEKNNEICKILFIYGDCFTINDSLYNEICNNICKELEKVEYVRLYVNSIVSAKDIISNIRCSWKIKVFDYIKNYYNNDNSFQLFAIMRKDKLNSFVDKDLFSISGLSIRNIVIKNPNNKYNNIDCILLYYQSKQM